MANLKRLIKGQDISFDTHQAGDGQRVKWRDVHLEKRVHGERGKAKFPLLSDESPSSKGMNHDVYNRVTREVKRELSKDPNLTKNLVDTVANTIERFSQGTATIEDGVIAAKKLSSYFDLDENIVSTLPNRFDKPNNMTLSTIHNKNGGPGFIEIVQSKKKVDIRKPSRETLSNHREKGLQY
ncbi:hypothetical protein AB4407_07800 [Vibrio sp. 10N.261.46.E11]|uniref:hypothetical protein n=1 Tax=Vibrio sp. 10N.261.46.E11 TaxID=3229662 RepID=UPI00354F132A